jgi:polysaccharide biosynthesis transport protein
MSVAPDSASPEVPAVLPASHLLPAVRPFQPYPHQRLPEAHLWDYWAVLVQRRWTVVTVFLGAVLATIVWTVTTRPVFTATALLRIEREEPRVLKFEQVVRDEPSNEPAQTQLQTYLKMLQSRTLANRVIELLDLRQNPEFRARDRRPGELTSAFAEHLQVDPVRNSRLIKVSFESRQPDLAARATNTLIDEFMAQHLDQKAGTTRYAVGFLATQVEEARRRLEAAEGQLSQFLEQNDIQFVATDPRIGERQALVSQQLVALSDALQKAKAERIAKESVLAQATRGDANAIPAVLQNPLISHLKEEAATLEGKYRELGQAFKAEYPRMQRLAENIAEVRRQLRGEVRRVVESIRTEYRAAAENEAEIRKVVEEQQRLARKLDGQMAQYNLLRREADTDREIYAALSSRLKETQISAALVTSNISVVDRAEAPFTPSSRGAALSLVIGSMIGLLGGIALAFFFEYLDTSIRDPREVEAILRVPTLGLVPARSVLADRWTTGDYGDAGSFALVTHEATGSQLAEAFRGVRTSVVYSVLDHPPRTMLITSLQQQDGKTSVSTNSAISLAQLGMGDVLLIDADLRHPNLHDILEVPQSPGLSAFLAGRAELPRVIRPARIPGLYVIPAGAVPANPSELLSSHRFTQALTALRERFVHIVIDTPPMLGVSDTLVLAPRVEGVILVLRHGRSNRHAAQRAIQMLGSVHARVLGVVLNHVDVRNAAMGDYGYYSPGTPAASAYVSATKTEPEPARPRSGPDEDGEWRF